MAQPVDRVERKRRGEDRLSRVLDALGEARDNLDDRRAVERRRRDEVRDREAVQDCNVIRGVSAVGGSRRGWQTLRTDAEAGAGYAVRNGRDPGELRLVDREVGRARALDALGVEDVGACGRGHRLDLEEAAEMRK